MESMKLDNNYLDITFKAKVPVNQLQGIKSEIE